MNFKINLNGNGKADFVQAHRDASRAYAELVEAMNGLWAMTHGRNYQTCQDPAADQVSDQHRIHRAVTELVAVDKVIADFGRTIVRQDR